MSDDDLFDDINLVPWDDLGRINQDGFVENENLEQNPVFFDDQFEMRSRELQASPPGMKTVNVFPSKQGPWSGNNQLGIAQRFAPNSNNEQTIIKLDEWGMPEMWTLCLGLSFDPNAWVTVEPGAANFDMTAIIQFGIGGVVQEVEIDWVNGTAISLPMNALNVIARYNFTAASEAGGASEPPQDLLLRASLAHGTLLQCVPTRSLFVDVNAGDVTVNIPPFAKSLKIIPTTSNDGQVFTIYSLPLATVDFRSDVEENLGSGLLLERHPFSQFVSYLDIASAAIGTPVSVDIPSGARSIVIRPETEADLSLSFRIQFEIGV